jgi:citrate lyase beta subunit
MTPMTDLDASLRSFARRYAGESADRQPVHTVYGGADLFGPATAGRLGELARRFLDEYAPDAETLADIVGWDDPALGPVVFERVREKLEREPVEDFRIDFEDGFGNRPDAEEDATARSAAAAAAEGLTNGSLPPFLGIRIKPLSAELAGRALRTLELFLSTLVRETDGELPPNFVVTLPKVVIPEQVTALVGEFERLEAALPIEPGALRLELMVETPQSLIGADGTMALPGLVDAAAGRCAAAHFGVYDYTASVQVTAAHQTMRHPACDLARGLMQIALSGTGVWLSDGATNVLPVPLHRASKEDPPLSGTLQAENRRSVHDAWRLHYDDVRQSLRSAFYQGWDLHPAQLVTRYAAVYSFFLEGLDAASDRLRNFMDGAARASLSRDVMDDAATGHGLLNYFLRGLNCGAITAEEASATGLTLDEIRSLSFLEILEGRRGDFSRDGDSD